MHSGDQTVKKNNNQVRQYKQCDFIKEIAF